MRLATLSTLIITSIAFIPGIASAQTAITNNSGEPINTVISFSTLGKNSMNSSYLQPFNIVFLAYQGQLKEQGIASGSALISEYQLKKVTAKDVVQAAIKANKLPAEVLNDLSYLNAVESQLTSLDVNLSY